MVRKKKKTTSKRSSKKSKIRSFVEKEKSFVYYKCTHPLACHFEFWMDDWHRRLVFAFILGLVLAVFSQMYPVCTQDTCYDNFVDLVYNPSLLTKPFATSLLVPQFVILLTGFTWFWFILSSIFTWLYHKQWLPELALPFIVISLMIYLLLLTSGALTPFVVSVGDLDCVVDDDCIRAGYVGEVCASVYKPVYTTYTPDLEPLEKCSCIENVCVGS